MNKTHPIPYQLLSEENDVFTTYCFWAGALVIKMMLMSFLTAFQRLRKKVCSMVQCVFDNKNNKKNGQAFQNVRQIKKIRTSLQREMNDLVVSTKKTKFILRC